MPRGSQTVHWRKSNIFCQRCLYCFSRHSNSLCEFQSEVPHALTQPRVSLVAVSHQVDGLGLLAGFTAQTACLQDEEECSVSATPKGVWSNPFLNAVHAAMLQTQVDTAQKGRVNRGL